MSFEAAPETCVIGTCSFGYFRAPLHHMEDRLGPTVPEIIDTLAIYWKLRKGSLVVTIYQYKANMKMLRMLPTVPWHVGTNDEDSLSAEELSAFLGVPVQMDVYMALQAGKRVEQTADDERRMRRQQTKWLFQDIGHLF